MSLLTGNQPAGGVAQGGFAGFGNTQQGQQGGTQGFGGFSAPPPTSAPGTFGTQQTGTPGFGGFSAPAGGGGSALPQVSFGGISGIQSTQGGMNTGTAGFGGGFAAPPVSVAQAPPSNFGGLGGTQQGGGSTGAPGFGGGFSVIKHPEARDWKDLPVPAEVLQLVDDLRNHIKGHKVKMTELARASDKNIDKLSEEIEQIRLSILNLTNQVCRQSMICTTLIKDVAEEMKNADMAMVTRDTPLALQGDITDPTSYFFRLVNGYVERMTIYKREIERCETALHSVVEGGSSAKDLPAVMKVTKNTVVSLAAKVQELHEQVYNELITHKNLKRFASGGMSGRDTFGATATMTFGQPAGNSRTESSPNLVSGDRLSSRVFGQDAARGSSGVDPVIPPSVNNQYNQTYERVNSIFSSAPQRESRSFYRSSTPIRHRGEFQSPPPLFNTASSTILGNQTSFGQGMKRSKDN